MKILKEVFQLYINKSDFFLEILLQHMMICGIAIVIASIIGILLGIIISEFKKTTSPVLSLVNFIYTIPSIALLGFFIPISGIGDKTAVIALTIYALLPMVRSTYTGIETIDPAIIESAKGMGSTDYQILYKIKLPLATTVILSGLRNMVVMTIALGGIASFIGAGGLGVAIYRGITTNNAALTVAGSLLIAVLALVVDLIIGLIEKFIKRKWKLN
ncbi:MAG: ABC transporter permease [Terrisporobacter othiniensis]|uniref:ABC transporter permease n=1 Tax=Terrisporobacter TaxID=1505652 RepID=UPI000B0A5CA4|nr:MULTISPECIES: ABC transporter permease [Terrisporobacter]MDU4861517.1 ABC transporter permease [Terrisporobacter othiniensis]MDU6995564.1 ABC transporter permease [Terrisporobacter othiniensis]UPA30924.1 ABC transporter permease [Terrisporobacter glycolicus]